MQKEVTVFPYFQPIVSVASGRVIGYEALARQYDGQQNVISAGALFLSKNTPPEQLRELDRQVRWMALKKFADLEDKTSYLTINISASWIDYITNINKLPTLEMLKKLDIDTSRIVIEITEGEVDIDKLKGVVNRYRHHGVRVAVDDYGSGCSQLDRIVAINPDIIKVDGHLFKRATKGGAASEAVQLLTRFGKRLGCQIIFEGVENMHEFMFALSCGAQCIQGFLFSAAEPEFKSAETYQKHITSLRKKFLARQLPKEQKKIQQLCEVKRLAFKLKEALQDDFNLDELSTWGFEDQGVLKFYLCNAEGEQISPDFNFKDQHWFTDTRHVGINWSWRPYFYQIIALNNCGIDDQLVTSDSYRDFDSGILCKTLSLHLDSERILMIDMKNEEH